jgi:hypothetical protein
MLNAVADLKVDNVDFLVTSLIERCPRAMMLRELVQNGIDAAASAPPGLRFVRLGATHVDSVRKLTIWNTGAGMTAEELFRMCDIAASIRKKMGLSDNFGMGAKVAGLGSNPLGMRYRSCRAGRVHEVLIGRRDGAFGRIPLPGAGGLADVIDATEIVMREGGELRGDWTEVTLLGQRPDQDTVADPYGGDVEAGANWIAEGLFKRYLRLPPGIEITLHDELLDGSGAWRFRPLSERPDHGGALKETVVDPDTGIRVTYFYDPPHPERPWENLSSRDERQTQPGLLALAHRGEMYRAAVGSPWAYVAAGYGISFMPRNYSVVVELPDDHPVVPDTYRLFLQKTQAEQSELAVTGFASLVRRLRPAWLLDQQAAFAGAGAMRAELLGEIKDLAQGLGVSTLDDPDDPDRGLPFRVIPLRDANDIRDRWLLDRAAMYHPETRELYVNMGYVSAQRLAARVISLLGGGDAAEDLRKRTQELAEAALLRRVCRSAVHGVSKAHEQFWNEGNLKRVLSPESFSAVAEDLHGAEQLIVATLEQEFERPTSVARR